VQLLQCLFHSLTRGGLKACPSSLRIVSFVSDAGRSDGRAPPEHTFDVDRRRFPVEMIDRHRQRAARAPIKASCRRSCILWRAFAARARFLPCFSARCARAETGRSGWGCRLVTLERGSNRQRPAATRSGPRALDARLVFLALPPSVGTTPARCPLSAFRLLPPRRRSRAKRLPKGPSNPQSVMGAPSSRRLLTSSPFSVVGR
jgi:hypothetical protein